MDEIEKEVIKAIGAQEMSDLNTMIVSPGWKVYIKILERMMSEQIMNSRKNWRDTQENAHTNGIADGLEKAMNAVDIEIEEYEQQVN